MKISTIIEPVEGILILIGVICFVLFMFTLILGGLSAIQGDSMCKEVNYNIERTYPIRAGCWFWKPIN